MSNQLAIGNIIRDARKNAGLTQKELGDILGVTGVSIMRYEKGERTPSHGMLYDIANAVGIQIDYFFPMAPWDDLLDTLQQVLGAHDREEAIEVICEELDAVPARVSKVISSQEDSLFSQKLKYTARMLIKEFSNEGLNDLLVAKLLTPFRHLNDAGRKRAIEMVSELTEIPKYQRGAGD